MTRPIFLLTDFGTADTYVGIVKAVILGIAPDARIADLTHEVPPQDIRAGAFALLTAAPYLPRDAVVLAVVDPGVGTARRPIAVQVGSRTFVGPDNGLLSWALTAEPGSLTPPPSQREREKERERETAPHQPDTSSRQHAPSEIGSYSAVVLDRPAFWLPSVSATFHGRDLFGPVAAGLARGVPLADLGSPIGEIETIPFPVPRVTRAADGLIHAVHGEVIHVDRYGNLVTSLRAPDLPEQPIVMIGGRAIAGLSPHFQDAGPGLLIALIGSAGLLEVAVPNGSAAKMLGVGVGAAVSVSVGHRPS